MQSTSRRAIAIAALILTVGLVSPAGAHLGGVAHTWRRHFKPRALELFYTKAESSSRFLSAASGSVGDGHIQNVTRRVEIPVHELDPVFTDGPAPGRALYGEFPVLLFDAGIAETIQAAFRVPQDLAGTGNVGIELQWSAAATSGSVSWSVFMSRVDPGEDVVTTPDDFGVTAPDAALPESDGLNLLTPSFAAVSFTPGQLVGLEVSRFATAPQDTMVGDARLHHIAITYEATR